MAEQESGRLSGRVAIVTGGTRGIGLAITRELAQAGADVVPTSRTDEDVRTATELVESCGQESVAVTMDVSSDCDVARVVERTVDELGGIDILVNNAGINPDAALGLPEQLESDAISTTIDVNLQGVFRCIGEAAPHLRDASAGVVINIASVGGVVGLPRQHPYVASKHGLIGMTRSIALDWAPDVRVNAIAPGYVTTELTAGVRENDSLYQSIIDDTPLERFAEPREIAGPAVFLASDDASYITGECLTVDGGWTAR